jgi:L-alanine-DL-glutamate epimerase-like enolase superfamily enzyme
MTASAHVGSAPHGTRIQSVSACTISVPLADPVSLATRRVTVRDYTLVRVRGDIENHARLAERTSVPVATGEIEAGRWRHKELLDRRAASILQTDAAVCGGITEFRRIAAIADGYGVTLSPHWFHDLHVHLVAATPNARFVEYFSDNRVLNFQRIIDGQLEVRKGMLSLPKLPGLGFDFDEQAIAKLSQDGWK